MTIALATDGSGLTPRTPKPRRSRLKRILLEGAGAAEYVDFDGDIVDTEFDALGYESLALLETSSRIEREYGIALDESAVAEAITPNAASGSATPGMRNGGK